MFLRSDEPSPESKAVARTITVIPTWIAVIVVAVLNVVVAGHLLSGDDSLPWIWVQALGIAVLIFTIVGLVLLTRKMRRLKQEANSDQ